MLTIFGVEHMLGGISGYDAEETSDEDPARVALVRRITLAYLQSQLFEGDKARNTVISELRANDEPPGRIECK